MVLTECDCLLKSDAELDDRNIIRPMPKGSPEPANQSLGNYAPLENWQRRVFAILGLAGIGAGGAATFLTDNSAGSGVLLALGALFLLIAVTGNPITRAKFADYEVGFGY